jgi:hypothetical protein
VNCHDVGLKQPVLQVKRRDDSPFGFLIDVHGMEQAM